VIVYGEKRLGIGGGICQVSSTLYNAALLGELNIVRRANHSIPVNYVPLGRDATVTDTGIDLVIENPHDHPIAIATELGALLADDTDTGAACPRTGRLC
jgi:vancomycin resistance protein YoaR